MPNILRVKNVNDYGRYLGVRELHPLVSVIDYAKVSPIRHSLNNYSVYGLFLRDDADVALTYGRSKYDYKEGTLLCVAPGQIGGKEDNGERVSITGWALLFHPDLLHGSDLERNIHNYSFFDYSVNEALHMTSDEHDIMVSLMRQMRDELLNKHDEQQDRIIVGYIELALNYCQRFYNRQFFTRKLENTDILKKFAALLHDYFARGIQLRQGIPSVQYCAEALCMSANYFGDTIKKTTGDTASSYIHGFVTARAKNLLAAGAGISQVAYDLGFEYPQHFSRMFKKQEGITPSEYCRRLGRR